MYRLCSFTRMLALFPSPSLTVHGVHSVHTYIKTMTTACETQTGVWTRNRRTRWGTWCDSTLFEIVRMHTPMVHLLATPASPRWTSCTHPITLGPHRTTTYLPVGCTSVPCHDSGDFRAKKSGTTSVSSTGRRRKFRQFPHISRTAILSPRHVWVQIFFSFRIVYHMH